MKNQKRISSKIQKLIYQEANSACPFCRVTDIHTLQIHHINSRAQGGDNEPQNLILVCSNCHNKITTGAISENLVLRTKLLLLSEKKDKPTSVASSPSIHLEDSINTGVVANTLNVRVPKRSTVKVNPPANSIAADLNKRNYIRYLIKQYIEFKKADKNIDKFNHAIIYNSIQTKFKCKWDFVSIDRFEALSTYLQSRIDGTILGRVRKSKNQRCYSTFIEFLEEQKVVS
ncbi:HNH endonuclease [candidate division KSB1 bacterium]|nr:MAG: HNH endonuclease [candidate division KSB1 bacterium]